MSFMEIAVWFAVTAFLVIRVAMLVAFVLLPVAVIRTMHRHGTA